jgi:hypothetical protein
VQALYVSCINKIRSPGKVGFDKRERGRREERKKGKIERGCESEIMSATGSRVGKCVDGWAKGGGAVRQQGRAKARCRDSGTTKAKREAREN